MSVHDPFWRAPAKDAIITLSALRAGDNQRCDTIKESPAFVGLAQIAAKLKA
jgi:hypothetical protein